MTHKTLFQHTIARFTRWHATATKPKPLMNLPGFAVAWLGGHLFLSLWRELPTWPVFMAVGVMVFCAMMTGIYIRSRCAWWVVGAGLGFLWVGMAAYWQAAQVLPYEAEGRRMEIMAKVVSLPIQKKGRIRFDVTRLKDENDSDGAENLPARIRLSYYLKKDDVRESLRLGDVIRATVKLKRPWTYRNPGSFDYEKYLFGKRIGATGYVMAYAIIETGDSWRQKIFARLRAVTLRYASGDAIMALTMGESGMLSEAHNDTLIKTGTRHLFAVSGMHIGMVFVTVFLLANFAWRWLSCLNRLWSRRGFAATVALPVACAYAWLAGFSIPTQRAVMMLSFICLVGLARYRLSLGQALGCALIMVLLADPLSILSVSFWFSFVATGAIVIYIYALSSSSSPQETDRLLSRLLHFRWVIFQCYISAVMLVASLMVFNVAAVAAPLNNLWAIPAVSFMILPGCLLTVIALPISATVAGWVAGLTDALFGFLWVGLDYAATWDVGFQARNPPLWSLWLAAVGLLALLFAYRRGTRVAALILFLPLWFSGDDQRLRGGEFKVVFLDVGHGLSAIIHTQNETMVFDTGVENPRFSATKRVVIPYLRATNIRRVNHMVISHGDNDHSGGVDTILSSFNVKRKIASPDFAATPGFETCHAGLKWLTDGVQFMFLHPPEGTTFAGNNASCVLRVGAPGRCVLLTADIEKEAEHVLTSGREDELRCPIILIPHHGSTTSSTRALIDAVRPRIGVVTVSRNNRYGLPAEQVLAEYERRDITVFNTAETGALSFLFAHDKPPCVNGAYRLDRRRYWHLTHPMRHNVSMARCV